MAEVRIYKGSVLVDPECWVVDALGDVEAEARLIAAAPQLVEVLEYLLEQTIEQDERYDVVLTEGEQDAAAKARALLAKINGAV